MLLSGTILGLFLFHMGIFWADISSPSNTARLKPSLFKAYSSDLESRYCEALLEWNTIESEPTEFCRETGGLYARISHINISGSNVEAVPNSGWNSLLSNEQITPGLFLPDRVAGIYSSVEPFTTYNAYVSSVEPIKESSVDGIPYFSGSAAIQPNSSNRYLGSGFIERVSVVPEVDYKIENPSASSTVDVHVKTLNPGFSRLPTLVVQKTFQHLSQSHHENLITLLNSMRCSKASRFR
ncbi:MAG: hypothetical protein ACFB0C_07075 [Leptolyngbyaceae cyanobacterium]